MTEKKKLYLSDTDKKIAGVCGGIGEYLNIDPTIVRLLAILLAVIYGSGILIYVAFALVIPERPSNT